MRRFTATDNDASRFSQRVRLERPVTSQDSLGDTLTTWLLVEEVWADIHPLGGDEARRHGGIHSRLTHAVWLRWRSDIRSDWRVVYQGRDLTIQSLVNVEEASTLIKLMVEEKT